MKSMANLAVIHDEHQVRLETKLRRELGDQVLSLLNGDRTEDILLNPDGALWVKRMSEGFSRLCEVPPAQAASALSTVYLPQRRKKWKDSTDQTTTER